MSKFDHWADIRDRSILPFAIAEPKAGAKPQPERPHKRRHCTTDQMKSIIAERWISGVKAEAIAHELGITIEYLRKVKRRMRLNPRLPNREFLPRLSPAKLARALHLWSNKKLDTARIANRLKVCEAAVYNSLSNERGKRHAERPVLDTGERRDAS